MKLNIKKFINPITIISSITVISLAFSFFFYRQYQISQNKLKVLSAQTPVTTVDQTQKIIENVAKLLELPTDETPTVATVTDREKLKDQSFFNIAQNGDHVLIYLQAKKAILYRPSLNKIVDIAPINVSSPSATPKPR